MTERTINEEIQIMIDHTLKQQPQPTLCKITKTYTGNYADIETNIGTLTYIPVIGTPTINNPGILFTLDTGEHIIITK